MATISHLVKGQSDWQETVNQLVDYVDGEGSDKWVDSTDGIVLSNGFQSLGHGCHYIYRQFGNGKIVDLIISLTLSADPGSKSMVKAVTLPDNFSAPYYAEFLENNGIQGTIQGNSVFFSSTGNSQGLWFGSQSHYVIHFTYVHLDD